MIKVLKILGVIVPWVLLFLFCFNDSPKTVPTDSRIDSLMLVIDSIKKHQDTLIVEIHTSDTIIKDVKEQYKKDSAIIATQSTVDDIEFFSKFLSTCNQ